MSKQLRCFKAYDVRGQIPNQLNADVCYRIGNATAEFLDARCVVVGRDMRLSSEEFADAVIGGLLEAGADVYISKRAAAEDLVEIPAPSWDDVADSCLALAPAHGAMLVDPAGQVLAARGDWPEPGPQAIAGRLVSMMEKKLRDAIERGVERARE